MSNGKYIDFVPNGTKRLSTRPLGKPASAVGAAKLVANTKLTTVRPVSRSAMIERKVPKTVAPRPTPLRSMGVKSEMPKLMEPKPATSKSALPKLMESKPVASKSTAVARAKMTGKPATEKLKPEDYRKKFVNLEKVKKRPLSKNVYPKKEVPMAAEAPSGPVTIIDKPEKDSKVGLIVTIIITIILGAAAGTVAFLLLPK